MTYTEARKRGDTHGQCRAYLKAKAETSCAALLSGTRSKNLGPSKLL